MTDDRPHRKTIYISASVVLLILLASVAFPLVESANTLGFLGEKSYLVILNDNTEIRNTGGLMACIGLLNVSDGAITGFTVYHSPDGPFNTTMAISGPESFLTFFNITRLPWYDVNVQYDFATFAPMMESSVQHELGWKVDGTIALDFTALAEIMKITGPLVVDNQTITSGNVVDSIHNATPSNGSASVTHLIRGLALKISAQLHDVSLQNSVALLSALKVMADQKHVLLYVPGNALLSNFDGALSKPPGDYISVVDANLGAAYVDFSVNRSLSYNVELLSDGSQTSHLTLSYDNQHSSKKYTVFSTALVPAGATLFATNSTTPDTEGTLVSNYSAFTTFSSLITVPANSTASVTYSYTLPRQVSASGVELRYDLCVQKQAGINQYTFTANVSPPPGSHVLITQGLGQVSLEQGDAHATLIYR
jgi:hypothetical protein